MVDRAGKSLGIGATWGEVGGGESPGTEEVGGGESPGTEEMGGGESPGTDVGEGESPGTEEVGGGESPGTGFVDVGDTPGAGEVRDSLGVSTLCGVVCVGPLEVSGGPVVLCATVGEK